MHTRQEINTFFHAMKTDVRVELENANHWLMVCHSVVDPILARQISLLIQARNITDEQGTCTRMPLMTWVEFVQFCIPCNQNSILLRDDFFRPRDDKTMH